jgi:hypothetical protein
VSVAVALADKLDTLVGFWAIDEKPTGSKDPYALRRAALGSIRLITGTVVRFRSLWRVVNDTPPDRFEEARDVINGAGLLKRGGQTMANWVDVENLQAETFTDVRHPRTIIGVDRRGDVWLAAIDGRQVDHSIGMTFAELVGLADRLGLVDALNLDGGGSTTMVMEGKVVNRPSDAAGPRPVSDAIVILPRATATSGL